MVEFSTLPELIAAIAYGPIYGIAICLFKDIIHTLLDRTAAISDFTNLLLNSSFIFIAGMLYSRSMFSGDKKVIKPEGYKRRDYRRKRIFKSAFFGAIISLVPQFIITRYIAYPMLERLYSDRGVTIPALLEDYQVCYDRVVRHLHLPETVAAFMPKLTNISRGILFINLPMTLVKLFIVTCITAIVYKWISPFLHNRKKKKKKK